MLRSAIDIQACTVGALDGTLGTVKDCVFDDEAWVIRYLIVRTGAWHSNEELTVPSNVIGQQDWLEKHLSVQFTRSGLRDRLAGAETQDRLYVPGSRDAHTSGLRLHSVNAVSKYGVQASDGDVGRLRGLLVDEQSWAIRFMVVQTGTWWLGHQVLIAPEWIDEARWAESTIWVDMTLHTVRRSMPYEDGTPMNGAWEAGIYHYDQPNE